MFNFLKITWIVSIAVVSASALWFLFGTFFLEPLDIHVGVAIVFIVFLIPALFFVLILIFILLKGWLPKRTFTQIAMLVLIAILTSIFSVFLLGNTVPFSSQSHNHLINSDHHGLYLHNTRGDVVQRVDAWGNILYTYHYDAFGNELYPSPGPSSSPSDDNTNTNPFRFAAEYWDWETNTYYLRARHFNPITGRFTQPDPHWNIHNMMFGDSPTLHNNRHMPSIHAILQAGNLYVYTMNNPVTWVDPSGRTAIPAISPREIEKAARVAAEAALLVLGVLGVDAFDGFLGPISLGGSNQPGGTVLVGGVEPGAAAVPTADSVGVSGSVFGARSNTIELDGVTFTLASDVTSKLAQGTGRHFMAVIFDYKLYINPAFALSTPDARIAFQGGQDIWSVSQHDARMVAGGVHAVGPENSFRGGRETGLYFWHYHSGAPTYRRVHSFYAFGVPGLGGMFR